MIKAETIGDEIETTFKGVTKDLINEMGNAIKVFAKDVLEVDAIDWLKIFTNAFEWEREIEASNETHMH